MHKTVIERVALYPLKILCSTKRARKQQLIEAGFEYVTERDGFKIYRKRE